MRIVYDEAKRQLTITRRGYDFADLDEAFFASARIITIKEGRLMAVGEFRARLISVVFKPLGSEAVSVITMRRASKKERRLQ